MTQWSNAFMRRMPAEIRGHMDTVCNIAAVLTIVDFSVRTVAFVLEFVFQKN